MVTTCLLLLLLQVSTKLHVVTCLPACLLLLLLQVSSKLQKMNDVKKTLKQELEVRPQAAGWGGRGRTTVCCVIIIV